MTVRKHNSNCRVREIRQAPSPLREKKNNIKGALVAAVSGHDALIEQEVDVYEVTEGAFNKAGLTASSAMKSCCATKGNQWDEEAFSFADLVPL